MPDPVWTEEYNYSATPETNGFTRQIYNTPVINEVTGGNPGDRRVEINSDNGDVAFVTSQVPSLDPNVGATAEAQVRVTGAGDAGFELTFLDAAFLVNVFGNFINLSQPPGDNGDPGTELDVAVGLDNSTDTLIRFTFDGSRQIRIYRNGTQVAGPITANVVTKSFQRVLWWGEGGGTQVFNIMRYFIGGAVEPG